MPAWPSNLDFFQNADGGTRTQTQDHLSRYQPSIGPAIVRRRTQMTRKVFQAVSRALTEADAARLRAFYRDDLADGALSFTATDTYTGETLTYRFVGELEEKSLGTRSQFRTTLEAY